MNMTPHVPVITVVLHVLVQLGLIVRVLLRPHRQPASRVAWIVVIATLPVVGAITYLLFGEVNIGRHSFDLNYENNILFCDSRLTADVRKRQKEYILCSHLIEMEAVAAWSMSRRLWNNTVAMLGPLL